MDSSRLRQRHRSPFLFPVLLLVLLILQCAVAIHNPSSNDGALVLRRDVANSAPSLSYSFTHIQPTKRQLADTLLLVSTLDGCIHAVDRHTGAHIWRLNDPRGALIATKSPAPDQASSSSSDYVYLVEPHGDGSLYVFQHGKVVTKLSVSVKQLVQAPFRTDDGTVYTAKKTSTFVAIDALTGKIVQEINEDRQARDTECPRPNSAVSDVIFMGRVDYLLTISDSHSPESRWTIAYSEFIPVTMNGELFFDSIVSSAKSRMLDGEKVLLGHGGKIALSDARGKVAWLSYFDSPAVAAFALEPETEQYPDMPYAGYNLVRYNSHPTSSPSAPKAAALSAYVGAINNSLFVLSSTHFPLLADGPSGYLDGSASPAGAAAADASSLPAQRLTLPAGRTVELPFLYNCPVGSPDFPRCLIGVHEVTDSALDYNQDAGAGADSSQSANDADSFEDAPTIADHDDNSLDRQLVSPDADASHNSNSVSEKRDLIQATRAKAREVRGKVHNSLQEFEKDATPRVGFTLGVFATIAVGCAGWIIKQKLQMYVTRMRKRRKRLVALENNQPPQELSDAEKPPVQKQPSPAAPSKQPDPATPPAMQSPDALAEETLAVEQASESGSPVKRRQGSVTYGLGLTSPVMQEDGTTRINRLVLSDTVLGYGSHGTVVYKGVFEEREVAVKRLLLDFFDVAQHETNLLLESDDHYNVVRYYCKEQCDRFLYIALELCDCSLADVIEPVSHSPPIAAEMTKGLVAKKILYQILTGLHHLHQLKIVHRDLKPHNILLIRNKRRTWHPAGARVLISDFGLCKKLELDQSSFGHTVTHQGGTFGWRAPELLTHPTAPTSFSSHSSQDCVLVYNQLSPSPSSTAHSTGSEANTSSSLVKSGRRITKAIDIFSLGCLFYYVLTGGDHPFGDRYSREINILRNQYSLDRLDILGDDSDIARDMISRMIHPDPALRPSTDALISSPFFWPPSRRLNFLQDVSDRFEVESRDPPSPLMQRLEHNAIDVVEGDWTRKIDRVLANNLGKYRKYDGQSVQNLLRALRNKKHHYQDLPPHVRRTLGELPQGFLNYFTSRFPKLFLHVYYVVLNEDSLRTDGLFRGYFQKQDEHDGAGL
ncbi:bifunctional endoribonuclease/protein kinase ire1 [Sorochytrium milnesiophthora]